MSFNSAVTWAQDLLFASRLLRQLSILETDILD